MEHVSDKCCRENQDTHFMFKTLYEIRVFLNVEKKFRSRERQRERESERESTDDSIIRGKKIRFVCRITRARLQTPSSCVTFIALIR